MRLGWTRRMLPAALAVAVLACIGEPLPAERRYSAKLKQKKIATLETPGLVIGEFALARKAVVDGDTIKIDGLDASLRLLCVDAEETFKSETDRRAFEAGWEQYVAAKRGNSQHPVKMATPVGDEGKHFAEKFFEGVDVVRLERDHPKEIRDFYNRYLSYVFVRKDGVWQNFNVELVRAGYSPYFSKYGYSRRFHDELVKAQEEARAARRGIWDPAKMHYPDYDERLRWWNHRGDFIQAFERDAEGKASWIVLTHWDSPRRLEEREGKEVTLLGAVADVKQGDKGPTRVQLSRRLKQPFSLIFFDKDVFASSGIAAYKGEYVRVRGVVTRYRNKYNGREELQIVVSLPGQIEGAAPLTEGADNAH